MNDLEKIKEEVIDLSIELGNKKEDVESKIEGLSYKQLISLKTDLGMLINWE